MTSRRQERLAAVYQKTISEFLKEEFSPRGMVLSVTRVEVGEGLKHLRIYFSVWPDEKKENMLKSLEHLKKELRRHLAEKVKTKFAPELEFKLDESEKKRAEIEKLLKKMK